MLDKWGSRPDPTADNVSSDRTALCPRFQNIGKLTTRIPPDLLERRVQRLIANRHPITEDSKLHQKGTLHSEPTPGCAPRNGKSHPEKPNRSQNEGQEPYLRGPSHGDSRNRHSGAEANPATPGPSERRGDVLLVFERRHDRTMSAGPLHQVGHAEYRGDRTATAGNNQCKARNDDHGLGKYAGERQGSGTSSL